MILLEPNNKIITDCLLARFDCLEEKPEGLDVQLADFDGVIYHLTTPDSENKNIIRVSMGMKCYRGDLEKYGATQILLREYGDLLSSNVEQGYDVSIIYDERSIPPEERAELVRRISYLKCNAMSAPFEKAFESQLHAKPLSELMAIHYREEESIWINAMQDRVTVIFSVRFRDETDKIFGKVFLQEFVDCRRQQALQNAPQALYSSREPPMELRSVRNLKESDQIGYVTFVLFPRHFNSPQHQQTTISLIQYFRDYLHYHIKCSKAYMHSRMRAKAESWLKILNRAKPENDERVKKTATGKTFIRK